MGRITIQPIGCIYNDYKGKFGIPRQSGLSENMISKIVLDTEYQDINYLKGIEEFSHIWLIWYFSEVNKKNITPTVRPPKLGGNKRIGVFATRSPFRPNQLGLSCVRLIKTDFNQKEGNVLYVAGADLMDSTPIIDIKPYLPYTDIRTDATNGFAFDDIQGPLEIHYDEEMIKRIPSDKVEGLLESLRQDPRPSYQDDSNRIYGMSFSEYEIKFKVYDNILTIVDII